MAKYGSTLISTVFTVAVFLHGGIVISALFESLWIPFYTWEAIGFLINLLGLILWQFMDQTKRDRLLSILFIYCLMRWGGSWLYGDVAEIYTTVISVLMYFPVLIGCGALSLVSKHLEIPSVIFLVLSAYKGMSRPEVSDTLLAEWRLIPAIIGLYFLYSVFFRTWRSHLSILQEVSDRENQLNLTLQTTTAHQLASRMGSVSRLSGEVAHEFNNLLNVITPICDFLESELVQSQHREDVHQIQMAAERMRVLNQDLLSLTQTSRVIMRVVDIVSVLRVMERDFEQLVTLKHPETSFSIPPHVSEAKIYGTEEEINRLILFLYDHICSLGQNDHITISLNLISASKIYPPLEEVQRGEVALMTIGQSIDISKDSLLALHSKPLSFDQMGSDFKLSSAYAIALRAGGTIRVGMNEQDQITYNAYLPTAKKHPDSTTLNLLVDQPSQPKEAIIDLQSSPKQEKVERLTPQERSPKSDQETPLTHILLVDDEISVLKVITRSLEREGYKVTSTPSSLAALELLKTHGCEYQLLITDIRMPELSGPEMIQRAQDEGIELPTYLYITGYVDDQTAASFQVAAEYVLFKPFTPKTLKERVKQLLTAE